ncbi:MAG TPA: GAF domain-containing sensor histidine kinase [Candidatus Angelobacter sp.]|nr:GAF domain-containing sensor histidine kinase [Candidatus Angelobacter sp.]
MLEPQTQPLRLTFLPRRLIPHSLRGTPSGYVLAGACVLVLVGLAITDLASPPNVTVSAIGVFAVLSAAWFLSLRMTIVVVVVGVLLQILLVAVGALSDQVRAQLHIQGVFWLTAVADVAAFLLTAALGRFAARNWAEMDDGLRRERALLDERRLAQERLESVLAVNQSIVEGRPLEEVLQLVASRARVLARAAVAAIAVPDSGHRTYTIQAVDGDGASGLIGLQVRTTSGSSGSVLRTRKSLKVEDLASELSSGGAEDPGQLGPATLVPLAAGRRRYGTLVLANLRGSRVLSAHDPLVELFASQAALALEYGRVRDELQRLALVEDRNRISQELHDGVIQSLFAIGLELESSASDLDSEHREAVKTSIAGINSVIRDLRGFIYGLLPGLLDEHGLHDALLRLTTDFSSKLKIKATASIDPELAEILAPHGVQLVLFGTEALSNLARHSGAASCSMTLARIGEDAVLEIRDEGSGFDPDRAFGQGFGLQNLRERATRLHGRLSILSAPGKGTAVRLIIPLKHTKKRPKTVTNAVTGPAG